MRILPTSTLAAALLALPIASRAQFPTGDMDPRSLGLGYTFALSGQDITDAFVPSHEVLHQVVLGYAPIPYLALQAGIGLDRFSVEPDAGARFNGDYGFSPSFGILGFSPAFASDLLRGTGGVLARSLRSEDGRGYRYAALVTNPFLGLVVSPSRFVDVTLGGRLHFVDGTMEGPRTGELEFANTDIARGYLSVTIKSPYERAFLHLDADFSGQAESDWSEGPREASVSLSVGAVLGWKGKSRPQGHVPAEKPTYFPAYPEMKERQDKMAEELE